jgi:hypothetical protein
MDEYTIRQDEGGEVWEIIRPDGRWFADVRTKTSAEKIAKALNEALKKQAE